MALSKRLKARYNENYLLETRQGRGENESFGQWHSRISENDQYIRGEFSVVTADGAQAMSKPIVGNLMDQMPRDLARLANEVEPTYRAPAFGDTRDHLDNAIQRAVITEGYFIRNKFDITRPQLVMDLATAGAAFMVLWVDSKLDVPRMMRIDPRACYPDIYNGEIQDLLVVSKMKVRIADRLFPSARIFSRHSALKGSEEGASDYVEIWDLYAPDVVLKAVSLIDGGGEPIENGLEMVAHWVPDLKDGMPPVAFAQVPSPDGALRGLIDQVGPGLAAKNQIANYILEYSEQMVHAPFEYKGIVNPTDSPGPNTLYAHDPNSTTETFMRRVEPASTNPQLFSLMQFMDDEQRKQIAYPSSRQGDVQQSQGSASFVTASQGQYTSLARDTQRLLSDIQEQAGCIAQQLDVKFLDFQKPMHRALGRKRMYVPSKVYKDGFYGISVNYGAGSGLDRLNTDVRLIQFYGSGLISMETVLENLDFVSDAPTEIEKRQREEVMRIVLQRWAGDPNTAIDFMIRLAEIQDEQGASFREALQLVNQEMAAQVPAEQGGMMGQEASVAGGTPQAAPTQEGLAAGAAPSEPIVEPSFSNQAMVQAFVTQPEQ